MLIIVIIILVAASGFLLYFSRPPKLPQLDNPYPPQQREEQKIDSNIEIGPTSSSSESKSYQEYSKSAFDASSNKKRVLFFFASWCPTCKPADAGFTANASKFQEDLVVFRVNYNDPDTDATEKALAEKYGITYQHTFVQVDSGGETITKWNGGGLDKLLSSIK